MNLPTNAEAFLYTRQCITAEQVTKIKQLLMHEEHIDMQQNRHRVFYGVESWSGVMEWSIGVEWSQIFEWSSSDI